MTAYVTHFIEFSTIKAAQYNPHVCHTPCQRGALGLDVTLIQS